MMCFGRLLLASAAVLQLTSGWLANAEGLAWAKLPMRVDEDGLYEGSRAEGDDNVTWLSADVDSVTWLSANMEKESRASWSGKQMVSAGQTITLDPPGAAFKHKVVVQTDKGSTLKLTCTNYDEQDFFDLIVKSKGVKKEVFWELSDSIEFTTKNNKLILVTKNYWQEAMTLSCTVTATGTTVTTTTKKPVTGNPTTSKPGTCKCGLANKAKRIVGGSKASDREVPWIVEVVTRTNGGSFGCGGTIISPKHVVTAAHCTKLQGKKTLSVKVNYGADNLRSNDMKTINVKVWHDHPKYSPSAYADDITVLELESAISFNSKVSPACLPDPATEYGGMDSLLAGWGNMGGNLGFPNDLMKVTIPLETNAYCEKNALKSFDGKVMICNRFINGLDSCQGDSGGPVTVEVGGKHQLVGAVSYGPSPCAKVGPGINTRVSAYLDWIKGIVSKNNDALCTDW